jgi:acyl carrier protein
MSDLEAEIVQVFRKICYPNTPDLSDPEKQLLETTMDSLDWASSLLALEDKFKVSIGETDIENLTTIRKIAEYFGGRLNG